MAHSRKELSMSRQSGSDPKQEALRARGALNPHPERVLDPLFDDDELFDRRDLVQVKYEMIRRARIEGQPVMEACRSFGLSRPVFYRSEQALKQEGLPGLVARKRGPRGPHKLTGAAMMLVEQELEEDRSLDSKALARRLKEQLDLEVHPRSIERALARRKKKPR
jgi:transposase